MRARPQLQAAISHAKATGAKLVIARLDRLARNPHFVQASGNAAWTRGGRYARRDPIAVNIVSSEAVSFQVETKPGEPKLTANQKTLFGMLHAAGSAGLTLEDWNNQAREAGIGVKRKADLNDIRAALLSKQLVRNYNDRWNVVHE